MNKEEQRKREAEIKLDELDDRGFDFDNWSISDAYERGYCDCAEPREKRIAELIALINAERERQEKCDDVHLRTIAELEKENAELKKQLEMSNKVYNDNLDYSHHTEEQLTKAKEIIKSLYFIIESRIDYKNNIEIADEMWRAEQFWKVEK